MHSVYNAQRINFKNFLQITTSSVELLRWFEEVAQSFQVAEVFEWLKWRGTKPEFHNQVSGTRVLKVWFLPEQGSLLELRCGTHRRRHLGCLFETLRSPENWLFLTFNLHTKRKCEHNTKCGLYYSGNCEAVTCWIQTRSRLHVKSLEWGCQGSHKSQGVQTECSMSQKYTRQIAPLEV